MAGPDLPEVPERLKGVRHYLKIASTYDRRDVVVSYWCRLFALQTGLNLSTRTAEETSFLLKLTDWLETTKKEQRDNEAITNDVAAQAYLENWALKLFLYADKMDRTSVFGKSVVQSFYTAGILYDVLTMFGALSEEASQNEKYAKWKASYIHNCLKNGETPVPGPLPEGSEDLAVRNDPTDENSLENTTETPTIPPSFMIRPDENKETNSNPSTPTNSSQHNPLSGFTNISIPRALTDESDSDIKTEGGASLSVDQMAKAQKYIKWAGSALNYDDVPTSIANLRKALHLLTTGHDLA